VNLKHSFKFQFVRNGSKVPAFVHAQRGGNKQYRVGSSRTSLVQLILVDCEILAQDGDVGKRARCKHVIESSAEIFFISKHRQRSSSAFPVAGYYI